MKTITINHSEFYNACKYSFLMVKSDHHFSENEVFELSVEPNSCNNFSNTTKMFRISAISNFHPGIRNSYIVVFLKPYKVPAWVVIKHFFDKIFRFFFPKKTTRKSKAVSIRPIPNNRSDSAFRNTQVVKTKKGKTRNLKLRSKKI